MTKKAQEAYIRIRRMHKMTKKAQEAYIRGFCKKAEANGIEPEALYKYAQLKSILVGGRRLTSKAVPKYILGARPTKSLYLGNLGRNVPPEIRAAMLQDLLTRRASRSFGVARAIDKANLPFEARLRFHDALDSTRRSAAGSMLDNARTNLFDRGLSTPYDTIPELQGVLRRDLYM